MNANSSEINYNNILPEVDDTMDCMTKSRQALVTSDTDLAHETYEHLKSKSQEYLSSFYGNIEIVTCSDYTYDVWQMLSTGSDNVDKRTIY